MEELKNIIIEIGMIKHALRQFNKMAEFTGGDFENEKNELLDRLIILKKKKEDLENRKKK